MIGKLRHLVDIEQQSSSGAGTRGQPTNTWSALYSNVYAAIDSLSGREAENARQIVPQATYKVTIRYHASIDTGMRVAFGSRYFNIEYIDRKQQRTRGYLELLCTEGA